jgi:O-antigen/teichoic acid export membrane protein
VTRNEPITAEEPTETDGTDSPGAVAGGGRRRTLAGVVDQVVNAGANAATGLLVILFVDPAAASVILFAIGCGYFTIGIARALVGDVLLTYSARYDVTERARQARDAAKTAALLGVLGGVIAVIAWAVGPDYLGELIWLAPFLPFVLVHDAGRYVFLAGRQPQRALISDLTWVAVQAAVLTPLLFAGARGGGVFLVAWGLGGVAGTVSFLVRARINLLNPFRGDLRAWLVETRHLSGWLTGTALIGQAQVQLVYVLVTEILSKPALAMLRLAQYGLLMPAQNLQIAVSGLLVPRLSAQAGAGDADGVRRLVRKALLATALCAAVPVLLSPLAGPIIDALRPKYHDAASLALPTALQAAIYLLQVPFTAALRGMQQVRLLFVQYVIFAAASAIGLVTGSVTGGLPGASWGLLTGAAIGFAVMILAYRHALRSLVRTSVGSTIDSQPHPEDGPA